MSPFIETIRIEEGQAHNLAFHNQRLNKTRRELYGCMQLLDLAACIDPGSYATRTKCRVEYSREIQKIEYLPYTVRPVNSLRLVEAGPIDYTYKSTDRSRLNSLFAQRQDTDDVLIVRNGLLTDTSICNVALWDGTCWKTPEKPLLEGTMRSFLLEQGLIYPAIIRPEDLSSYSSIRLFNALIGFGEIEFPVEQIF